MPVGRSTLSADPWMSVSVSTYVSDSHRDSVALGWNCPIRTRNPWEGKARMVGPRPANKEETNRFHPGGQGLWRRRRREETRQRAPLGQDTLLRAAPFSTLTPSSRRHKLGSTSRHDWPGGTEEEGVPMVCPVCPSALLSALSTLSVPPCHLVLAGQASSRTRGNYSVTAALLV